MRIRSTKTSFAEAESLLVEAFEAARTTLGTDHHATDQIKERLVVLYNARQKPDMADRYRSLEAG